MAIVKHLYERTDNVSSSYKYEVSSMIAKPLSGKPAVEKDYTLTEWPVLSLGARQAAPFFKGHLLREILPTRRLKFVL